MLARNTYAIKDFNSNTYLSCIKINRHVDGLKFGPKEIAFRFSHPETWGNILDDEIVSAILQIFDHTSGQEYRKRTRIEYSNDLKSAINRKLAVVNLKTDEVEYTGFDVLEFAKEYIKEYFLPSEDYSYTNTFDDFPYLSHVRLIFDYVSGQYNPDAIYTIVQFDGTSHPINNIVTDKCYVDCRFDVFWYAKFSKDEFVMRKLANEDFEYIQIDAEEIVNAWNNLLPLALLPENL